MKSTPIDKWLAELGSKTPAPGGGAVAGLNAATAAAMIKMVFEYTSGPKFAGIEDKVKAHIGDFENLIKESLEQAENDEQAYKAVREAYAISKDDMNRPLAIQSALQAAVQPALETIKITEKILDITAHTKDYLNQNLISDIAVAAANAKSALESAIVNIEINASQIKDSELKKQLADQVAYAEKLSARADKIVQDVRNKLEGSR